jgi:hypothetical protein
MGYSYETSYDKTQVRVNSLKIKIVHINAAYTFHYIIYYKIAIWGSPFSRLNMIPHRLNNPNPLILRQPDIFPGAASTNMIGHQAHAPAEPNEGVQMLYVKLAQALIFRSFSVLDRTESNECCENRYETESVRQAGICT